MHSGQFSPKYSPLLLGLCARALQSHYLCNQMHSQPAILFIQDKNKIRSTQALPRAGRASGYSLYNESAHSLSQNRTTPNFSRIFIIKKMWVGGSLLVAAACEPYKLQHLSCPSHAVAGGSVRPDLGCHRRQPGRGRVSSRLHQRLRLVRVVAPAKQDHQPRQRQHHTKNHVEHTRGVPVVPIGAPLCEH